MRKRIKSIVLSAVKALFGLVAIILGLVLTPLPLPFGVPLIFLGSFLVVQNFPPAKRAWQNFRRNNPKMDKQIARRQTQFENWRRKNGW